ncbi:MAG: LysM peptidoglycan-binding domain-containing protein [Bacteroidetes bacterium]|nr:LysM peptidoglycan-binding domain-containing protein [Bacteroidota bacterium]
MKKILTALFAVLLFGKVSGFNEIPEKMEYCGMELVIDADARALLSESVTKIKRYPTSFQSMVDRGNIFFPFVEEALSLRGVPDDLKYIVIMESAFVGDAVSSSNAVGFWQFKEQSGRESGLVIDEYVDERKHIFLSSLGAAKYFYTIARYFDNYLFAIVGYNRGPVGALPFIVNDELGSKKVKITKDTHWYALKAIAHKIAYQDAIHKADPPMWLQPLSTNGETDVKKLADAAGLSIDDFRKYNLWIKGAKLPEGKSFIYYVPRQGKQDLAALRHVRGSAGNTKQIGGGNPVKVEVKPKAKPVVETEARDTRRFTYLEANQDPQLGAEYVRVKKGESLVEIAVRYKLKPKKLKELNGFSNSYRPQEGDLVYLKAAKSRYFHIVQPGESLEKIAVQYATTVEKLRDKNRMTGNNVFAGQKLSLKKKVAKGSKPTLLAAPSIEAPLEVEEITEKPVIVPEKKVDVVIPNSAGLLDDPAAYRLADFESKWVTHTVAQNESVWKIAKKYGAFAEVVKKVNGLASNEVKPGTELKILQVLDRK